MPPLIEKKPKQDTRAKKQSYAFYLSRGLVEDLGRVARDTGRSKSEVLEILAKAGLDMHETSKT
jgi:hypothetical protein